MKHYTQNTHGVLHGSVFYAHLAPSTKAIQAIQSIQSIQAIQVSKAYDTTITGNAYNAYNCKAIMLPTSKTLFDNTITVCLYLGVYTVKCIRVSIILEYYNRLKKYIMVAYPYKSLYGLYHYIDENRSFQYRKIISIRFCILVVELFPRIRMFKYYKLVKGIMTGTKWVTTIKLNKSSSKDGNIGYEYSIITEGDKPNKDELEAALEELRSIIFLQRELLEKDRLVS